MDDGSPDLQVLFLILIPLSEVELLVKVLKNKFNLNCSIHTRKDVAITPYFCILKRIIEISL